MRDCQSAVLVARSALTAARLPRAMRCASLAACALLIGSQGLQTAVANGDTRTISFHHIHTGETDHRHLQAQRPLRRRRRSRRSTMSCATGAATKRSAWTRSVIDIVWEVNREVGGKEPIQIICGYRAPATNQMLRRRSRGVAQFSQHTLGKAIDFYIPGVSLEQVRDRRPAAAARRRRLLSELRLVRPSRRRQRAPLAAHDPRPARPRVPERPHRACPVRRPAAVRLCARARRHREARQLARRRCRSTPPRNAGIAISDEAASAACSRRCSAGQGRGRGLRDGERAGARAASKASPPARTVTASVAPVPLPMARPVMREADKPRKAGRELVRARLGDRQAGSARLVRPAGARAVENVFAARGMWEGPQGRPEPPAAIPEPAPVEVASAVPVAIPALGPARPARTEPRRPTTRPAQ